jgi:hypothetical protein
MSELSKADVISVLGPRLSDAAIAEIIATGISPDELVAARDRVLRDRAAHDPGPPLEPSRMAEVVEILEGMHANGLLGEAGSRLV